MNNLLSYCSRQLRDSIILFIHQILNPIYPAHYSKNNNLIFTQRFFFKQKSHWDCGAACCVTMLTWANCYRSEHENFQPAVTTQKFELYVYSHEITKDLIDTPLWTIDLLLIIMDALKLKYPRSDVDVAVHMYTTCLGVNDDYLQDIKWYNDLMIENSREAINSRFEDAINRGYSIIKKKLELSYLKEMLNHSNGDCDCDCIAIALVNAQSLKNTELNSDLTNFSGHYIVLFDYLSGSDEFLYLDPAVQYAECLSIKTTAFLEAWSYPGTDCDIIVCTKKLNSLKKNISPGP